MNSNVMGHERCQQTSHDVRRGFRPHRLPGAIGVQSVGNDRLRFGAQQWATKRGTVHSTSARETNQQKPK